MATQLRSKSKQVYGRKAQTELASVCLRHKCNENLNSLIQKYLLEWYDKNRRDLPWRHKEVFADSNQHAYAVWVSEVMLQQTQVATVVNYYNKWIAKWPTIECLANASQQEVHTVWAGLGYYSRSTRLLQGAQKVMKEMKGTLPSTADKLIKEIPGVGPYTAGAIASIAFNEVTGVVDGNVIRVFSRMFEIGADSTSQSVMSHFWNLANEMVDEKRPGDFNQALMELGATVCSPKSPNCQKCPVKSCCSAYATVELTSAKQKEHLLGKPADETSVTDLEDVVEDCSLCIQKPEVYDKSMGVMNFPRKAKKKAARQETTVVCVIFKADAQNNRLYFIQKRPSTGLLAGLWEFPNQLISEEDASTCDETVSCVLKNAVEDLGEKQPVSVGEVIHLFSHIHQTYKVYAVEVPAGSREKCENKDDVQWKSKQEIMSSAISTAMKKVFKKFEEEEKVTSKKRKSSDNQKNTKRQLTLSSYFNKT